MANFYLVATPIGNLEDISLRALRVLKESDIVFSEKPLKTKRLFDRHEISTPLKRYHQHSSTAICDKVINLLKQGKDVSFVSEAGTPGISDPGGKLVEAVISNLNNTVNVIAIPGPSALATLVSICDFDLSRFLFLGFLPNKKGRRKFLDLIKTSSFPVIVYESVYRIEKLLKELQSLGIKEVTVGRELTKKFETVYRGSPEKILDQLTKETKKGEFVVAIKK